MRALVIAMGVAACGRFHFDPLGGGDGAIGDGVTLPCTGSSFGMPHAFPTGMEAWDIAAGDIDGDGRPDLAIQNDIGPGGTTTILHNTGGGQFSAPAPIAEPDCPTLVKLVDINRDGALDLVMAIGQISVRLGDGHGMFGAPAYFATNGAGLPDNLAIGDVDGDGHLDIVVMPLDSQTGNVLYGDGAGGFTAAAMLVDGFPYWVATSDLDGDGKSDLVVGILGGGANELQIMMATATRGTFTSTRNTTVGGGIVAIGDLDRDGHVDMVVTQGSGSVAILRGLGGTQFSAPTMAPLAAGAPSSIDLVDVDGDGMLDVVAPREIDNAVVVAYGNGDATFAPPIAYAVPGPNAVVVRDLDGDGHPDLAVADRGMNSVQIVVQTCTQ